MNPFSIFRYSHCLLIQEVNDDEEDMRDLYGEDGILCERHTRLSIHCHWMIRASWLIEFGRGLRQLGGQVSLRCSHVEHT